MNRNEAVKMALAIKDMCTSRNNCSDCPLFFDRICLAGPDELPKQIKEKVKMMFETEVRE